MNQKDMSKISASEDKKTVTLGPWDFKVKEGKNEPELNYID